MFEEKKLCKRYKLLDKMTKVEWLKVREEVEDRKVEMPMWKHNRP